MVHPLGTSTFVVPQTITIEGAAFHATQLKQLQELFGDVEWGAELGSEASVSFHLVEVTKNYYSGPVGEGRLFIVAPNAVLRCVWPRRDVDEVRYGNASVHDVLNKGDELQVPAIYVQKGADGLYLCLTPDGKHVRGPCSLGV